MSVEGNLKNKTLWPETVYQTKRISRSGSVTFVFLLKILHSNSPESDAHLLLLLYNTTVAASVSMPRLVT